MGLFSSIGDVVSKVVKGAGQVAGNVVSVAAPVLGQVAHAVASNIPVVSSVYGSVTNLAGKDLRDYSKLIGDVGSSVLKGGVGAIKDIPKVALTSLGYMPASDAASAQQVHAAMQMNGALGQPPPDLSNTSVSFNSVPVVNGLAITPSLAESTFDTNPILQPVVLASGEADRTVNAALQAQGVSPTVLAAGLQGGSSSTLGRILDLVSGTAVNVNDILTPRSTATTNTNWLLPALVVALGGLAYYFTKKK